MAEGPIWLSESRLHLLGWMLKDMFWSMRLHFSLLGLCSFILASLSSSACLACSPELQREPPVFTRHTAWLIHEESALYSSSGLPLREHSSPPSVSLQLLCLREPFHLLAHADFHAAFIQTWEPLGAPWQWKGQIKQALCLAASHPLQFIFV